VRRISWGETQKWVSLYENSKTREEKLRNEFFLTEIANFGKTEKNFFFLLFGKSLERFFGKQYKIR